MKTKETEKRKEKILTQLDFNKDKKKWRPRQGKDNGQGKRKENNKRKEISIVNRKGRLR